MIGGRLYTRKDTRARTHVLVHTSTSVTARRNTSTGTHARHQHVTGSVSHCLLVAAEEAVDELRNSRALLEQCSPTCFLKHKVPHPHRRIPVDTVWGLGFGVWAFRVHILHALQSVMNRLSQLFSLCMLASAHPRIPNRSAISQPETPNPQRAAPFGLDVSARYHARKPQQRVLPHPWVYGLGF